MQDAADQAARILADRGLLTLLVATLAWLLKRLVDATLPRGWHFRIIERWLQRGDQDREDTDKEDEEQR